MVPFSFLRLAAELRIETYEHLWESYDKYSFQLQLRLVCHQVKSEYDIEVIRIMHNHIKTLVAIETFPLVPRFPKRVTLQDIRHLKLGVRLWDMWDETAPDINCVKTIVPESLLLRSPPHVSTITISVYHEEDDDRPSESLRSRQDRYSTALWVAAGNIGAALKDSGAGLRLRFLWDRVMQESGMSMIPRSHIYSGSHLVTIRRSHGLSFFTPTVQHYKATQMDNPSGDQGRGIRDGFGTIAAPANVIIIAQDLSKSSLLDIPAELRLVVYKSLVNPRDIRSGELQNLRATCQQIRQELDYEVAKSMRDAFNDRISARSCYGPTRSTKRALGKLEASVDAIIWQLWLPMSSLLRAMPHPRLPIPTTIMRFDTIEMIIAARIPPRVNKVVLQYYQDFGDDTDLKLRRLQDFLRGLLVTQMREHLYTCIMNTEESVVPRVYEVLWVQNVTKVQPAQIQSHYPLDGSRYELRHTTVAGIYRESTSGPEKEGIIATQFTVDRPFRVGS
ncbi:hypothetical protein K491DRAFT_739175 [Lophiostoma macrostomum CBS 122681]|uniref:Uncharacterized protein n=1 Tax=Lophiostoma macrostomum CBS 122681 TaxID=1314788 RepID=A0A6A6SK63_9PLEO|nr:hypothetical protein K491DRAFT_739175 [Lophiostoma macrostomum CBS 122681]